jgi:hypothetical protein
VHSLSIRGIAAVDPAWAPLYAASVVGVAAAGGGAGGDLRANGGCTIVPPEYRSLGCLSPEQFIPQLMKHLGLEYYVGLLSAGTRCAGSTILPRVPTSRARP